MEKEKQKSEKEITIADLYPELSEEEQAEAEANLDRYLEHALRMYDRIRLDPEAYARFKALTASEGRSTIQRDPSNPT